MNPIEYTLNLIYPPFCVGCGKLLPTTHTTPLCDACLVKWDGEKHTLCPECLREHIKCSCMPYLLRGHTGRVMHLARYTKWDSVTKKFILSAKDNKYIYLYKFLACELADLVQRRMTVDSDTVITYVPRDKRKVRTSGVDQAKFMAELLAKRLGVPCIKAFVHNGSTEQKGLTAQERLLNAQNTYELAQNLHGQLQDKRVILYDDVITTGATLCACASLLETAGVRRVSVLAVGHTVKDNRTVEDDEIIEQEPDFEDDFGDFDVESEFDD